MIKDIQSWYEVAGQKYVNKLQAYAVARPRGFWPHWYFYEQEFSAADWTREPHESLSMLYRDRARYLRQKYDRIIVWSSGGADSDNVIRSFYENDLHIDEIWHRHTMPWHNRRDQGVDPANHCQELSLAFVPRLEEYRARYDLFRYTRVNAFDVVDRTLPLWNQSPITDPYQINAYNFLAAMKANKSQMGDHGSSSSGSTCHVYGIDKPLIRRIHGEWFVTFSDNMVLNHCVPSATDDYSEEFFYWDPLNVKLIAKQAHIIKNFFNQNQYLRDMMSDPAYPSNRSIMDIIKLLIYPHWNTGWWQPDKHDNDLFWGEIPWFYQNPSDKATANVAALARAYSQEVNRIYSQAPADENNTRTVNGHEILPANYSKFYKFAND